MGTAIGVHPGLAAGMIVSGAVFGDKMSPLSDTTNFASGIVEVPLLNIFSILRGRRFQVLLLQQSLHW